MTKSTITREQAELRAFITGFLTDQAHDKQSADSLTAKVFRIALAVLDSEPVAEVLSNRPDNDTSIVDVALPVGTQLYRHAQPAPVVPDELNTRTANDVMNEHLSWKDYGDAEVFCIAWNACRAAMLTAAPQSPGSEPATVPGKWIPVSERMPEVGAKVLCFPLEDEPIHATFNGQLWLQDVSWSESYEPIDNVITCKVTHWMPLPAAPQEVKGES
ncbi:DUF551 domain-containing protein [Klebsiella pneumoniae]